MQDAVGGGAQQQLQTTAAMTANHHKVDFLAGSVVMNFGGWASETHLGMGSGQKSVTGTEGYELVSGPLQQVVGQLRDVQRNITAVGKAKGFDDMHQGDPGLTAGEFKQGGGPIDHLVRFGPEVESDEQMTVHGAFSMNPGPGGLTC